MSVVVGRSGGWIGIAMADAWAVVDLPDGDPREHDLAAALGAANLSAALDVLLRAGVSVAPHFAMISLVDGQVRYLVRGAASVVLVGEATSQTVAGHASPTWVDAYAAGQVVEVRLCAPNAGAAVPIDEVSKVGELSVRLPPGSKAVSNAVPAEELAAAPADPPQGVRESVFFDLLTDNTTTRDALAQSLLDAQATDADAASLPETVHPAPTQQLMSGDTATWEGTSSWSPPPTPLLAPPVATPPLPPAVRGGIIEAFPWEVSGPPLAAPVAAPVPAPDSPSTPPPYVPPAAPLLPIPPSPSPAEAVLDASDITRKRAALAAMLRDPTPLGPTVLAVVCPNSHWSSPYVPSCRVCGVPVVEQHPQRITRPPLGRITLSTGATVTLDKGVIFGRLPQTSAEGAARPNLVKLDSPEISRQHAEIRLVEWQVLVRDLGSGNGTTITLPGRAAEMIRPNVDYPLEPGTLVGIADIVSITYEVTA